MVFANVETLLLDLALAVVFGGLIGFERETDQRPAGLRTHILICFGATLFTLISMSFPGSEIDTSRVASGIVTGIGFLGAGAIFRSEKGVEGLTTAADIWAVAAIGMAIGIGYYLAALVGTIIIFAVLFIGRRIKGNGKKQEKK